MEKNKGTLKVGNAVVTKGDHGEPPTLAEIGVTKKESSEAQQLADLPEDEKEKGSIATCSIASLFSICPPLPPLTANHNQLDRDFCKFYSKRRRSKIRATILLSLSGFHW